MGKKSVKTDKNIYFKAREAANLTRSQASELLDFISESRLEKLETGKTPIQPEDVAVMASAYKKPNLCNYYCANECVIGQNAVPEIKMSSLSEIVLGLLASFNSINKGQDRLIEITADGDITDDELVDFAKIEAQLDRISLTVDALKLWIANEIASGRIDKDKLDKARQLLQSK